MQTLEVSLAGCAAPSRRSGTPLVRAGGRSKGTGWRLVPWRSMLAIRRRGMAFVAVAVLMVIGAFLPWIHVNWVSGVEAGYSPFQSQLLGSPVAGFLVLASAATLLAIGLANLRTGAWTKWQSFACGFIFIALAIAMLEDGNEANRIADRTQPIPAWPTVAVGGWIEVVVVAIGLASILIAELALRVRIEDPGSTSETAASRAM